MSGVQRGQVFIRGKKAAGGYGAIDLFDLDEESFRRLMITLFAKQGMVEVCSLDPGEAQDVVPYRERGADATMLAKPAAVPVLDPASLQALVQAAQVAVAPVAKPADPTT